MRFSIITPSYNYSEYLTDTLESVRAQSFGGAVEHVVVDDASGEQAAIDILLARRDDLVLDLRTANEGLARTLNRCLGMASGEWIGWLNADDFYLPDTLSLVDRYIQGSPEVDVVFGDHALVDQRGQLLRLVGQHRMSHTVLRRFGPHVAPSAMFVRREILARCGFDPLTRKLMDWDLFLTLHRMSARFGYTSVPLGTYRRHERQESVVLAEGDTAEWTRIASRHGIRLSRAGTVAGTVMHGILKIRDGSYLRECEAASFAGCDLSWFRSCDAAANCERLVSIVGLGHGSGRSFVRSGRGLVGAVRRGVRHSEFRSHGA